MEAPQNKIDLFIDCGAPSLYNKLSRKDTKKGVMGSFMKDRVDDDFSYVDTDEYQEYIEAYISFLQANKEHITIYSNLDVINSGELTYKNQQRLEAAGLSPVPVYHLGEDIKWLKKYLDYDYISIGGIVPNPPKVTTPMLDELWSSYLTDSKGMPRTKVHGFAVTAVRLMRRYPWYSVDSTTWVAIGRNGNIIVPKRKNGKYVYDENYLVVTVSEKSPDIDKEGKHFDTMPESTRQIVLDYIEEKGFDIEGLRTDYKQRDQLNIVYFLDFEKSMPEWPWKFQHRVNKGFGL